MIEMRSELYIKIMSVKYQNDVCFKKAAVFAREEQTNSPEVRSGSKEDTHPFSDLKVLEKTTISLT